MDERDVEIARLRKQVQALKRRPVVEEPVVAVAEIPEPSYAWECRMHTASKALGGRTLVKLCELGGRYFLEITEEDFIRMYDYGQLDT